MHRLSPLPPSFARSQLLSSPFLSIFLSLSFSPHSLDLFIYLLCVCVYWRALSTTFPRLVPFPRTVLKGAAKPLWLCEPNVRVYDRSFVSLMKESLVASYASFYTPTYVCGQVAVVKFSAILNTRRSLLWICLRPRRLTH